MTTPLYPPQRPLSVGETLDLSFRIYRQTLIKCLPLAALAIVASQLPTLYLLLSGRGLKQPLMVTMADPVYRIIYLVSVLLALVLNAAILLRQYNLCTGSQPGGEMSAALRRAPALILFGMLTFLAILVSCLPAVLIFMGAPKLLAVLVCVATVSYAIVSLSCAYALLVVARAAPLASLTRSWSLTRGSFWRLSAVYTVALVILIVLYVLLGAATAFVVALAAHGDVAVVTAAYAVVVVALGSFAVPFYMAVQLAVLGDLTARREGADLAQRIAATA